MKKRYLMISIVLTATCLLCGPFIYGARIYVDVAATGGARNGSSWSDAFTRLDSGLMNSFSGDTIWVKAGRYYPVGSKTSAYYNIPSGRKIFGGFSGSEQTENDRNLNSNKTYLDGDIGTKGQASDNSYNVVRITNAASSTLLDGFHIVNGYAYSSSGGISVGGGGMRINAGSPQISNCVFTDNYTYMRGGAVYTENSAVPTFRNCAFNSNSTGNDVQSFGGAVFSNAGTVYFYDCIFYDNQSIRGGALTLNSSGVLSRCKISGNRSVSGGGAAIYLFDNGALNMQNSLLAGNHASGTSIINMSGTFNLNTHSIYNCTFTDNRVGGSNSATLMDNSNTRVRNCIFWNNSSSVQIYYFPTAVEPIVSNCIVSGGYNYGTNISSASPQFINPNAPQNAPFDASLYNYALKAGSAAVDAGDSTYLQSANKTDLNKNPRILGNNTDLGAIESGFLAWRMVLSGSGNGTAYGAGIYPDDSMVRLVAIPDSCGLFYRWTENGQTVSWDSIYSFKADTNRSLIAEFRKRPFAVSAEASPAGSGNIGNTGIYYCSDSTFTLVAQAANCYRFKEWRENNTVVGTSQFFNFKPAGNRQLTAVFTPIVYTASVSLSPAGGGQITGAGTYACDSMVSLRAIAKPGYSFSAWKENGNTVSTDSFLVYKAISNRSFTAVFSGGTGLEQIQEDPVKVFPNPFRDVLHIHFNSDSDIFYSIYALNGALLKETVLQPGNHILSLQNLPAGMYILHIQNGSWNYRRVIVKE